MNLKPKNSQEKNSQSPAKASDASSAQSSAGAQLQEVGSGEAERRRLPRILLTDEQFRLEGPGGKVFGVLDCSTEGFSVRLIDSSDLLLFTLGSTVKGILKLGEERVRVTARVRGLGLDRAGLQFHESESSALLKVADYTDPSRLGKALELRPHPDPKLQWYAGPSGASVLAWPGERILVVVHGAYVQIRMTQGPALEGAVETGLVGDILHRVRGGSILREEWAELRADAKRDPEKLEMARLLIAGSVIPAPLQKQILGELSHS
jgi:hypothetical protein